MTRRIAFAGLFALSVSGCTPLPNAEQIEEVAYGESPSRLIPWPGSAQDQDPSKTYFSVRGTANVDSYYVISNYNWRFLPRERGRQEAALQRSGFGPHALYGMTAVRNGRSYYFIPVCNGRANFDFTRFLPEARLGYVREVILRCPQ
jgi:hypothetical protein